MKKQTDTKKNNSNIIEIKQYKNGDRIINQKYIIQQKFADEPFSKVYLVKNYSKVRVIKLENQLVDYPQIPNQIIILKQIFAINQWFPRLYQYGQLDNHNYMITQLLGPNLAQLHRLCNNRFSIRTCILIGLQILDRLQVLHSLGYIYRDMKLQNFTIGLEQDTNFIYMIDFGHCQRFRLQQNNSHRPYQQGNKNLDDMTFTSINIHNNIQYSRRDDIESLFYMIIFMLKGRLPWKKVQAKSKKQKDQIIGQMKKTVSPSYLSYTFGIQMADLLWYIRSVNYYQKPDYDYIRNKFYIILQTKSQIKDKLQIKYDWNQRQQLDFTIYTGQPKIILNKIQRKNQKIQSISEIKDVIDIKGNFSLL